MGTLRNFLFKARKIDAAVVVIAYPLIFWLVLPLAAAFILFFAIQDIGPDYRAMVQDGTTGTFTATRVEEHHVKFKSHLRWFGDFQPDDGGPMRQDIPILDDRQDLHIGFSLKAIDTGSRTGVYPIGNGTSLLYAGALLIASIAGLAYWFYRVWCAFGERQRRGTPLEKSGLTLGPRKFGPLGYQLRNHRTGRFHLVRSWDAVSSRLIDDEVESGVNNPQTTLSIDGRVRQQLDETWGEMPEYVRLNLKKRRR